MRYNWIMDVSIKRDGFSPLLITEVKVSSPFGFRSKRSWSELFELANHSGDIISVHTDPRWGGSFDLIKKAKKLTSKPILAKGIHASDEDVEKAMHAGADYVLVVGRLPQVHTSSCWIEPNDLAQLSSLPKNAKVVWNQRNLQTGGAKLESFDQAREIWPDWLCQASLIRSMKDINPKANAILIGTFLEEFIGSTKGEKYE